MSMSVSASNNALAYLQQLLQSGSGGVGATSTDPLLALGQTLTGAEGASQPQSGTSPMGSGSAPTFESGTLAALISLQGQSASAVVGQSPSDLFSQLDTDGDGQISKTEFEQALGGVGVDTQSADALFGKLDANNDGDVSPSELSKGRGHHHHHHHVDNSDASQNGGSQQGGLSALLNSADITGASTQTATNSDGSTDDDYFLCRRHLGQHDHTGQQLKIAVRRTVAHRMTERRTTDRPGSGNNNLIEATDSNAVAIGDASCVRTLDNCLSARVLLKPPRQRLQQMRQ